MISRAVAHSRAGDTPAFQNYGKAGQGFGKCRSQPFSIYLVSSQCPGLKNPNLSFGIYGPFDILRALKMVFKPDGIGRQQNGLFLGQAGLILEFRIDSLLSKISLLSRRPV